MNPIASKRRLAGVAGIVAILAYAWISRTPPPSALAERLISQETTAESKEAPVSLVTPGARRAHAASMDKATPATATTALTEVPLRLNGIVSTGDPATSSAEIAWFQDADGWQTRLFRVGDKLAERLVVMDIGPDHVTVAEPPAGTSRRLVLTHADTAAQHSLPYFVEPAAYGRLSASVAERLLHPGQAGDSGDETTLSPPDLGIDPALMQTLGIRNDDRIITINGLRPTDLARMPLQSLLGGGRLELGVERDGESFVREVRASP